VLKRQVPPVDGPNLMKMAGVGLEIWAEYKVLCSQMVEPEVWDRLLRATGHRSLLALLMLSGVALQILHASLELFQPRRGPFCY